MNQQAGAAGVSADHAQAQRQADTDKALYELGVISGLAYKSSQEKAKALTTRNDLEGQRLTANRRAIESQMSQQQAKVDQIKTRAQLKQKELDALKVRARIDGVLVDLPMQVGQHVSPWTMLAKVVEPDHLMATLNRKLHYGVRTRVILSGPPMDSLPFTSVFVPYPHHLALLSCDGAKANEAINALSKALIESTDRDRDISALLHEADWRCHLVAAVALVISEPKPISKLVEVLWTVFDAGSWVSPQLAVCLEYIDSNFSVQAKARIESLCPVPTLPAASSREEAARRHVEQGPCGPIERSAKAIAALLYLGSLRPECEPWLSRCREDPSVQRLLTHDCDHGDMIAQQWKVLFNLALSAFRAS